MCLFTILNRNIIVARKNKNARPERNSRKDFSHPRMDEATARFTEDVTDYLVGCAENNLKEAIAESSSRKELYAREHSV